MQGPFYSAHMYYKARPDEPLTYSNDGSDRLFITVNDPVPSLQLAVRMVWFCMGKYAADYCLLYFEESEDLLDDELIWERFKPRYRLTAPHQDEGTITKLEV